MSVNLSLNKTTKLIRAMTTHTRREKSILLESTRHETEEMAHTEGKSK